MWAGRPERAQHLHSALAPPSSLTGPAVVTSSYFQQPGQMAATGGFFSCGDELRGENGGEREKRTARHCLTWGAPTQEKMGEGQSAPGRGPGGLSRGHCLAIGWLQVTFSRVEQRCKVVLSGGRSASTATGRKSNYQMKSRDGVYWLWSTEGSRANPRKGFLSGAWLKGRRSSPRGKGAAGKGALRGGRAAGINASSTTSAHVHSS